MLTFFQQQDRQNFLDSQKRYLSEMQSCEKTIINNHAVKKHFRPNMIWFLAQSRHCQTWSHQLCILTQTLHSITIQAFVVLHVDRDDERLDLSLRINVLC